MDGTLRRGMAVARSEPAGPGALGVAALLAVLLTSMPKVPARAAGDLDISFGRGGLVVSDFGTKEEYANAVAVQPDGMILVAGKRGPYGLSSKNDFLVARYLTDGRLDASFGRGGVVVTDFDRSYDMALDIALQPDGRIVVVGEADGGFAIARYTAEGDLDTTFGAGGKVISRLGASATAVAIQDDGKIVLGGCIACSSGLDKFVVARYEANGSVDGAFGNGGRVITTFTSGADDLYDLAIQLDGKIVAAGVALNDFGLARYLSNGRLDRSFGDGGRVVTDFAGYVDVAFGLALQPDGDILAGGYAVVGYDPFNQEDQDFAMARYLSDGSLDFSFERDGRATTDASQSVWGDQDQARAIALQSDGRIVAVGYALMDQHGSAANDFALVRYEPDGSLDTSFGGDGIVTTDLSSYEDAVAVGIQDDGRIVVAGWTILHTDDYQVALARYLGQ
jgi:uncharacterized delta-60 repeat protein